MERQAPQCCVCLASSVAGQATYLGLLVTSFVLVMAMALVMGRDEDDSGEADTAAIAIESIGALLVWVPAGIMFVSRVCIPCCCSGGMEEVGTCCPCVPFLQLDTPWYVMVAVGFLMEMLQWFLATGGQSFRMLRIVGPVLFLATLACAIVKLTIMMDCCCQECKPRAPASQPAVAPVVGHVVGQPVAGPGAVVGEVKQVAT